MIHEQKIRGTAGGIHGARQAFATDSVLVVNGDIFGPLPLAELASGSSEGLTLAVVPRPAGMGTVGLGRGGAVVRLRGELFGEEVASGDYMGVSRLGPRAVSSLPAQGCLIGDYALPWLRAGGSVATCLVDADFVDIGTIAAYAEANFRWLAARGLGHFVASGASLERDVELDRCVVGARARVVGRGALRDVIVLPGARARAPLEAALVLPSGRTIPIS